MQLTVNGQPETHKGIRTVRDLIDRYDLPIIRVAVEVNNELVPRRDFSTTDLHEGDIVEIVTLVGGGSCTTTNTK
jgi:thiamine biosynthesis protein ThiS